MSRTARRNRCDVDVNGADRGRWIVMLVAFLAIALLAVALPGCEKSADESASESGERTTEKPEPADDPEEPMTEGDTPILDGLAAAGFEPADDVPFDDEGALPADVASASADGQTALATHVLTDADERYIQVAIATFDTAESAGAAATADVPHVVVGNRVAFVFTFGESPTIDELKAAIAP